MNFIDLTGCKFGLLTVVERAPNDGRRTMWKCQCDCGNIVVVRAENLKSGNTKSCGCQARRNHFKHGMSNTKLAGILNGMIQRCNNKNHQEYGIYGGRGITVCDDWVCDHKSFYEWAIANGYREGLSIDRIDSNGNYEPSNCRWADTITQANNTRKNVYIEHDGEIHTISEWSQIIGVNYHTLWRRVVKQGRSIGDVVEEATK